MMQLAEDVPFPQRFLKLAQSLLAVGRAEVEEVAAMLGDLGQRCASFAFGLVCMGDGQQPAEIGIATEVARNEDQLFAVDLEGAADDRLDAELAARLEVAHRPVDSAPVRDCEGGHLELCRAHSELIGMPAAVE